MDIALPLGLAPMYVTGTPNGPDVLKVGTSKWISRMFIFASRVNWVSLENVDVPLHHQMNLSCSMDEVCVQHLLESALTRDP